MTNGEVATLESNHGALQPGVWTHIAGVYDGNYMIIYQNGLEVARTEKSGTIDQNPQIPVWIGSNPTVAISKPFDGIINQVLVYNRALNPNEISALANGAEVPAAQTTPTPIVPTATRTPTPKPTATPTPTPTATRLHPR